jgi:hypothetical protein
MRRSILAALAFTIVLAVPARAAASPTPAPPAQAPPAPHVIRPADGAGSNVVPHAVHASRAMDLLGWVDVKGERAGRAQAIDALRRKAVAMGADGIANVEFHPGAHGAPGHYTASAVMFRKRHARATPAATPAPASAQAHH